jgi:type IV pilus assembly protein PilV
LEGLVLKTARNQTGFTLIESLVALLVLSVGMLGIAVLYVESLSAGRTASYRSQAVNLAADMADRIRTNRRAQAAYAGGAANNGCDPNGGLPANNCTPAQMAAHDLFRWNQALANLLPGGNGNVQFNNGTLPPTYTITVSWTEVTEPAPLAYTMVIQVPLG